MNEHQPLWRPVEGRPSVIEVNLAQQHQGMDRHLPCWHWGDQEGWMEVALRDDTLYVATRRVILRQVPDQARRSPLSTFQHDPSKHFHPNILAACSEAKMVPNGWLAMAAREGADVSVLAWAAGYRFHQGGFPHVRCLRIGSDGYLSVEHECASIPLSLRCHAAVYG